jgi:hypothetical protein
MPDIPKIFFVRSHLDILLDTLGVITGKQSGILHEDVHIVGQRSQELRDPAMTGDVAGCIKGR